MAGAAAGPQRPALAVAAERSLQLLLIAAAITAITFVLVQLRLVVLPVIAALFLATALAPAARWLRAHRWPPALAALTTMTLAAAVLAGVAAAIVPPVAGEVDDLGASAREGLDEVLAWLTAGPLGVSERDINSAVDQGLQQLRDSSDLIAGGVISGALLIGELIAGILLAGVLLFFFLKDGDRIWGWLVDLAPAPRRHDLDEIGRRSWSTLSGYLRGVSIVAVIDAVLIGTTKAHGSSPTRLATITSRSDPRWVASSENPPSSAAATSCWRERQTKFCWQAYRAGCVAAGRRTCSAWTSTRSRLCPRAAHRTSPTSHSWPADAMSTDRR